MQIIKIDDKQMCNAVSEALSQGLVVLFPFDTVYGLMCDPNSEIAMERIFRIKGRDKIKTIGLAAADLQMIETVAEISSRQKKFIKSKIPGAYTFLVRARKDIAISSSCRKNGTIGIRVPAYFPLLRAVEAFGQPVAQTSANISGKANCYSIQEFIGQIACQELDVDLAVDAGSLPHNKPSTIFDLTKETFEAIERS